MVPVSLRGATGLRQHRDGRPAQVVEVKGVIARRQSQPLCAAHSTTKGLVVTTYAHPFVAPLPNRIRRFVLDVRPGVAAFYQCEVTHG